MNGAVYSRHNHRRRTDPLLPRGDPKPFTCFPPLVFADLRPKAVQQAFAIVKVLGRFPTETKKVQWQLQGDGVAVFHTCSRHRRSRTTALEGELDIITVVNVDDAPSQGIPVQIFVDNAKGRRSGRHTHSPSTFRAAMMTSAGTR